MIQDKMKCCLYGVELGCSFYILHSLKIQQNFEMEICLLGREGDISRQILLKNLKVIC